MRIAGWLISLIWAEKRSSISAVAPTAPTTATTAETAECGQADDEDSDNDSNDGWPSGTTCQSFRIMVRNLCNILAIRFCHAIVPA